MRRSPRYTPVWEPSEQVCALDVSSTNVRTVIWSIGFRSDYRWIDVLVFDGDYPMHQPGATSVSGLYFLGLPWLHTWGSGRFSGIAR